MDTTVPWPRLQGAPATSLGVSFRPSVHVLDLHIGFIAILLLEVLGEAVVPPAGAVLIVDGPVGDDGLSTARTVAPRARPPRLALTSYPRCSTRPTQGLVGRLTRATFCTVVSSSPGGGICEPRLPSTPNSMVAPEGPSKLCCGKGETSVPVQTKETETQEKSGTCPGPMPVHSRRS